MEVMTIGKLAELAGVGVETVRFYQRKKILKVPPKTGAFRTYNNDDVQKIIFIKNLYPFVLGIITFWRRQKLIYKNVGWVNSRFLLELNV